MLAEAHCGWTYWVSGVVLDGVLDLTVRAVVDVCGAVVPPETGEDGGSHRRQLWRHTHTWQSERGQLWGSCSVRKQLRRRLWGRLNFMCTTGITNTKLVFSVPRKWLYVCDWQRIQKSRGEGAPTCSWSIETVITLCDGRKLLGSFRRLVFDPSFATFALLPSFVAQREKWPCFILAARIISFPAWQVCFCIFHTSISIWQCETCYLRT